MSKEDLETKAKKAVVDIKTKVNKIYSILQDIGMKLCHVIEYKLDYSPFHKGIDYNNGYNKRKRK